MSSPTYAVYAKPSDVKRYLRVGDVDDDTLLLICCEWARAQIDTKTRRHFYPRTATRLYDVDGRRTLDLNADLISLTTLTNGDSTEITSSDYFLYPHCGPPYGWIELDESSGKIFTYSGSPQQALSVAGVWGYDKITEASGATVNSTYSTSGTSITPSSLTLFEAGDLLEISGDYMYVTYKGQASLTIKPGVNGSTSAGHAIGTAINIVYFPDEITNIATRLAAWRFKQVQMGFEQTANPALGVITIPAAIPVDIEQDLRRWVRRRTW